MAQSNWVEIKLPGLKQIAKFGFWSLGRLTFSGSIFVLDASFYTLQTGMTVIKWTKQAILNLVKIYDQLPYAGTHGSALIEATVTPVLMEPENIVTDLLASLSGKHCLIVGDTGTGKSLIAQWLAYQVGGDVTVYDPDAAPDEWLGLSVIGRGGDFTSIAAAMADDLAELQRRIEVRGEKGDRALAGMDSVTIAEEFPLLREEIEIATTWLIKHARRGRKPKRFVIALAQDDQVKTLGIEGEGGVRKCFRMLRLGKFAVSHAKSLKDTALENWLKAGKYRCTVDDYPCQLPDLTSYRSFTPRLQVQPIELVPENSQLKSAGGIQAENTDFEPVDSTVIRAVKACLEAGCSESRVIKDVLGYQGSEYKKGRHVLEQIIGALNT